MLTQKEKISKILFNFYFTDFLFFLASTYTAYCFFFYSGGLTILTVLVFSTVTD